VNLCRTSLFCALGLWLAPTSPADQVTPAAPPTPTRVYTNDDLDRVRPYRDEIGARSVPANPDSSEKPATGLRSTRANGKARDRGEAYWRREAARVRERLRTLADQAEALRSRMAEHQERKRRQPLRPHGSRASGTDPVRALEARIAAIERRMRELEEDLAERARRAGALPGWLR
jgi:uncharacterized coiled-coil protein SlyX